jgi:hypothetical protein
VIGPAPPSPDGSGNWGAPAFSGSGA